MKKIDFYNKIVSELEIIQTSLNSIRNTVKEEIISALAEEVEAN